MAKKVNEQVEHKGNPIRDIPEPRKPLDGKRSIPAEKELLTEKRGKQ